jgi:hypothetical protein
MLPRRAQTPIGFLLALCYVCAAAARTGPELTLGSDIGASVNIQTGLSDAASTAGCDEVVVGAGWAGVYFAYRRAMANPQIASKVSIQIRTLRDICPIYRTQAAAQCVSAHITQTTRARVMLCGASSVDRYSQPDDGTSAFMHEPIVVP